MHTPNTTANSVEYDATKNSVTAVSVFQADRAEIRRTIRVDLKDGQNDVEVKNLPTCLEEDSIRVDGIGNAVIFDVVYHPPTNGEKTQDVAEELRARKDELKEKLNIVTRQSEMMQEYSKTLTGKDTTADQFESFLEVYSRRQSHLDEQRRRLERDIKILEKEILEVRVKVNADEESLKKRSARITIVVLAQGDGTAELSLVYVVSNARWTPQYDLRASISSDPVVDPAKKGTVDANAASSVVLHYRASISQSTGEDWSNVELTLSTASPQQGTNIPTLNPLWVSELPSGWPGPGVSIPVTQGVAMSASRSRAFSSDSAPGQGFLCSAPAPIAPMARMQALVNANTGGGGRGGMRVQASEALEGAVSATFTIPGLSSIPSDSDKSQQTHKVSISELEFSSVDFEWITVPKKITSAFLKCKVQNTSKYLLLPGEANVFMNNNFVAKSRIPHVSPLEYFSCSLGVDPALRITYHPSSKKSRTTGGTILSGPKTAVTSFEQRISIRNTRVTRIRRLRVREHLPVSRNAKIKVILIEPKALAQRIGPTSVASQSMVNVANGPTGYLVSEGLRARWVPLKEQTGDDLATGGSNTGITQGKDSEEIDAESAQGLLEWICEIDAGASVDVVLAYEISAPAGTNWTQYT